MSTVENPRTEPEQVPPITLIVGCGDVGGRLARILLGHGHRVYGLRRKVGQLPQGVRPIRADLCSTDLGDLGEWPSRLDYVVYCPAAGRQEEQGYRQTYVQGLLRVLTRVNRYSQPPQRILFTSSTAVYHQSRGEWVDELSDTCPQTFNGQVMLEAERLLFDSGIQGTAVRFGGIYGPGRTYLLDKVRSREVYAEEPVVYGNRIHADDCACILAWLIGQDIEGVPIHPLYLGVDSNPAPLAEVSHWLAQQLNIVPESKIPRGNRGSKRCRNLRILDSGYTFLYPSYREGYQALVPTPLG